MRRIGRRFIIKIVVDIFIFAICVACAYFISNYMFTSIPIIGQSMESTIHDGDNVILFKPGKEYRNGDIVVFDCKDMAGNTVLEDGSVQDSKRLIKRIIASEGQKVSIKYNAETEKYVTYVDGEAIEEDYVNNIVALKEMDEVVVPEGKFFFMGDNRGVSADSRGTTQVIFGDYDTIIGRVIVRYQPDNDKFDLTFVHREKIRK